MKRLNLIKHYLYLFLVSILMLITTTSILLKFTIFSESFLINMLNTSNYYELLYNDIRIEMINNIPSSGMDESILEGLFTIDDLKMDTRNIIRDFCQGKIISSNDKIGTKLEENINNYIKSHNLVVNDQNEVREFIYLIGDIYNQNIIPFNLLNKVINYYNMINKALIIIAVISIINLGAIIVIKRRELNKYLPVSLMFTAFIYIFMYFYINNRLDVKHLIIFNESISLFIRDTMTFMLNSILYLAIIYIIIYIILELFYRKRCH